MVPSNFSREYTDIFFYSHMILFQGPVRVPAATELDLFLRQQPRRKSKARGAHPEAVQPKFLHKAFLIPNQQQRRVKNTFGLEDDQHGEEATALPRVRARHLAHASLPAQFLAEIFLLGR